MHYLIVLFAFLLMNGCAKDDVSVVPECIQAKIDEIASGEVWNPPAKVFKYYYNGGEVYYVPSKCCDFYSVLYDKDCKILCLPDGGLAGKGDGRCPDFFDSRSNGKLIWEDERQ